jgi:glycosyltransferase involved in cell wall biosynthesis
MTPPRRILFNATSLTEGGGRSYVQNVLRELDRDDRGFRFTVLVRSGALDDDRFANLEIETARLPRRESRMRPFARVGYEEVVLPFRARGFDLLYCIADVAPVLALAPVVVALRNLNIYDRRFYDTARLRALERIVRIGLHRARRVVFPSHAAAALIRRRIPIPDDRVAVVHHGISLEAFRTSGAEPNAHSAPYVFLPAALERHKNVKVMIESLLHVGDSRLEAWIAGASDTDPRHVVELRQLVQTLRLEARVRFLGSIPYRDVLRYYRGARALIFPSLLETFGHPLLEAMLTGTPIIAADIPALREIGADAAIYFPPRDARELARAIDRFVAEPEATSARIELGRARAAEFSWKSSVDRLCAVFEQAIGSR